MRRREFITLVGGAAAAWPLAARAQSTMPVIGFLGTISEAQSHGQVTAFRRGLSQVGFDEGRNVAFEFRWAEGRYERLPAMATELVRRPVALVLGQKRLEILREIAPKASVVAMLANPISPDAVPEIGTVQAAAQSMGVELAMFNVSAASEFDAAFAAIAE